MKGVNSYGCYRNPKIARSWMSANVHVFQDDLCSILLISQKKSNISKPYPIINIIKSQIYVKNNEIRLQGVSIQNAIIKSGITSIKFLIK